MIVAERFIEALRGGSSLPLVFDADDGGRYVVRMRGAGDGVIGLLVDWLGLGLARLIGLPAPTPQPIHVPADLHSGKIDPEHRELIERSIGTNLATPFAAGAKSASAEQATQCDTDLRRKVFLLDILLMNIDRTVANPNLLLINGELAVQDFDSAMALRLLIAKAAGTDESACMHELRRHVLYDDNFVAATASLLPGIGSDPISTLVLSVPTEWWTEFEQHHHRNVDLAALTANLTALVNDTATLRKHLDRLAEMPSISEDELRARRHAASRAARERLGR